MRSKFKTHPICQRSSEHVVAWRRTVASNAPPYMHAICCLFSDLSLLDVSLYRNFKKVTLFLTIHIKQKKIEIVIFNMFLPNISKYMRQNDKLKSM